MEPAVLLTTLILGALTLLVVLFVPLSFLGVSVFGLTVRAEPAARRLGTVVLRVAAFFAVVTLFTTAFFVLLLAGVAFRVALREAVRLELALVLVRFVIGVIRQNCGKM